MLAITKVILSYGCIDKSSTSRGTEGVFDDIENNEFQLTPAGSDLGMLNFENSLWAFIAMGGTFDVIGSSSKYDEFKRAMEIFEEDNFDFEKLIIKTDVLG